MRFSFDALTIHQDAFCQALAHKRITESFVDAELLAQAEAATIDRWDKEHDEFVAEDLQQEAQKPKRQRKKKTPTDSESQLAESEPVPVKPKRSRKKALTEVAVALESDVVASKLQTVQPDKCDNSEPVSKTKRTRRRKSVA